MGGLGPDSAAAPIIQRESAALLRGGPGLLPAHSRNFRKSRGDARRPARQPPPPPLLRCVAGARREAAARLMWAQPGPLQPPESRPSRRFPGDPDAPRDPDDAPASAHSPPPPLPLYRSARTRGHLASGAPPCPAGLLQGWGPWAPERRKSGQVGGARGRRRDRLQAPGAQAISSGELRQRAKGCRAHARRPHVPWRGAWRTPSPPFSLPPAPLGLCQGHACPCLSCASGSHACVLTTFSILSVKTLLNTILQTPVPLPVTSQTWPRGRVSDAPDRHPHLLGVFPGSWARA